MLRSVSFKNFVKFKEYQRLEFRDGGPFLFIGENGSGKSAVQEGIRRCLSSKLSTTVSSPFDKEKLSFFMCEFDLCNEEMEHVKCGFIALPDNLKPENLNPERDQSEASRVTQRVESYIKFATKFKGSEGAPLSVIMLSLKKTKAGELTDIITNKWHPIKEEKSKTIIELISKKTDDFDDESIVKHFQQMIREKNYVESSSFDDIMEPLSKCLVFTFPLHSIGPLQWSESHRIGIHERERNYTEAESRCEIIKCFLEDQEMEDHETKFDKKEENEIFNKISQPNDVNFALEDRKVVLKGKGKYALLKTPKGILEAKHFSILMSCKDYRTIILEEPERGMHPQFIERMLQIIRQKKDEKVVILTTHNITLITPWTAPGCFVFRYADEGYHIIPCRAICSKLKELRKLTSDHVADILFARRVVFYEGDTEWLFLTELKHQILSAEAQNVKFFEGDSQKFDKLKQMFLELTLVNIHGKENKSFCRKICKDLRLKYTFVVDRDFINDEEEETGKNRSREEWLVLRQKYLKPRHEKGNDSVFFWLDGTIEDMLKRMSENDVNLCEKLKNQKIDFNQKKPFNNHAIDCNNLRDGVKAVLEHCKKEDDLAALFRHLIEN